MMDSKFISTLVWIAVILILGGLMYCIYDSEKKDNRKYVANIEEYKENDDGTYRCQNHPFKYKLEVFGNAAKDDRTYVVLTNDKSITYREIDYMEIQANENPKFIILGWYVED